MAGRSQAADFKSSWTSVYELLGDAEHVCSCVGISRLPGFKGQTWRFSAGQARTYCVTAIVTSLRLVIPFIWICSGTALPVGVPGAMTMLIW
jgi:hypothetical protein